MELRSAHPGERDEVLDLLAGWYNDRNFFARYNQNDPTFRDEYCLIARDHGRLISTVQVFPRTLNLSGNSLEIGGIGSVYTLPAERGRGAASALLKLALERMPQWGFDVSLLFTERTDYYARFGWESVERQFSALMNLAAISPAGGYEIEPLDERRDLQAVIAIHRAYSGRYDLTVIRDAAAWRGNLRYAGDPNEYFVIARSGATPVAYARAMRFFGFPMVTEYGYMPEHRAAIPSILRHLGEVAESIASGEPVPDDIAARRAALARSDPNQPTGLLVTHSAHDPELEHSLTEAGVTVSHHGDRFYMWRATAPERLGARLGVAPEQAHRRMLQIASANTSLYWTSDRF